MRIISHRSHDVMSVCDAVITVSGTVTLELALLQKPMVVINKISKFSYYLVTRTLKLDHIALCNIVANKRVVPELIQNNATVDKITKELLNLLDNSEERNKIITEFSTLEEKLENKATKVELSDLLIDMLVNKS
jgi:lipid-A-disaccharide synthase